MTPTKQELDVKMIHGDKQICPKALATLRQPGVTCVVMPAKKKPSPQPAPGQVRHYDPNLGKAALASLASRMKDLDPNEVVSVRADIESATLGALAAYARATAPALRSRFQKQHDAGEFDMMHLDGLEDLAFAVLYAHAEASIHRATDSAAKLPADLVERAMEIESRMQRLCEYHFRDDPEMGPEVERLRSGNGHRDLATDLLGYARIYELRGDVVSADKKNYRENDVADAKAVAGVMFAALSAGPNNKARIAQDNLNRVWTLLLRSYDEVRAVGLHLLRHTQDRHRFFPSLYMVTRDSLGGRRKAKSSSREAAEPTDAS